VEALIRWRMPDGSYRSPDEFLAVAEETGLIVEISEWVLRTAIGTAARWHRGAWPKARVAINVSPRQFLDYRFVTRLDALLREYQLPARCLELELTEYVLQTSAHTIKTLDQLRELGVAVALDDFGTGYSSLSYLKQLPVDELKIDRSFVAGLGDDPNDTAIVAAIIAMAQALDVVVVAEGVETTEQLDRLRTLGCDQAQGFLLARPQPPHAIDAILATAAPLRLPGSGRDVDERGAALRVLVVDDSTEVRQLARISLASVGFDVIEAAEGHAALDIAAASKPDCIILDLMMPGMSGFEVCRQLRQQPWASRCTILMLTANDIAEDKIEAFSSGADDYIIKPFAPRDLASRVHAALRRRETQ